MTQSNELPDVLWATKSIYKQSADASEKVYLASNFNGDKFDHMAKFIRHGARTPFIDPKVQPIPDWVGDDELIYCNRLLAGITAYRGTMGAKAARWEHEAGRLLGYVILPL